MANRNAQTSARLRLSHQVAFAICGVQYTTRAVTSFPMNKEETENSLPNAETRTNLGVPETKGDGKRLFENDNCISAVVNSWAPIRGCPQRLISDGIFRFRPPICMVFE